MGKYSVDSKMKELLRNPQTSAVLEKWYPGATANPSIKLVQAMTFRKVLAFPECAELATHIDEIDADLKAVE